MASHHVMMWPVLFLLFLTLFLISAQQTPLTLTAAPANVAERFGSILIQGTLEASEEHPFYNGKYAANIRFRVPSAECQYESTTSSITAEMEWFDMSNGVNLVTHSFQMIPSDSEDEEETKLVAFSVKVPLSFQYVTELAPSSISYVIRIDTSPEKRECMVKYPHFEVSLSIVLPEDDGSSDLPITDAMILVTTSPSISTSLPNSHIQKAVVNLGFTGQYFDEDMGVFTLKVSDIDQTLIDLNTASESYSIAIIPTGIYQTTNLDKLFDYLECGVHIEDTLVHPAYFRVLSQSKIQYFSLDIPLEQVFQQHNMQQLLIQCKFRTTEQTKIQHSNLHRMPKNLGFAVAFPRLTDDQAQPCTDWTLNLSNCVYLSLSSQFQFKTFFSSYPTAPERQNHANWVKLGENLSTYADRSVVVPGKTEVMSTFQYTYKYHDPLFTIPETSSTPQSLSSRYFGVEFVSQDAQQFQDAEYNIQCVADINGVDLPFTLLTGKLVVPTDSDTIIGKPFEYSSITPKGNFWGLIPDATTEIFIEKPFHDYDPSEITCVHYQLSVTLKFLNTPIDPAPVTLLSPSIVFYFGNDQYNDRSSPDYTGMAYAASPVYPQFTPSPAPFNPSSALVLKSNLDIKYGFTTIFFELDTRHFKDIGHTLQLELLPQTGSGQSSFKFFSHGAKQVDSPIAITIDNSIFNAEIADDGHKIIANNVIIPLGVKSLLIRIPDTLLLLRDKDSEKSTPNLRISIPDVSIDVIQDEIITPTADSDYTPTPDQPQVEILSELDKKNGVIAFSIEIEPQTQQADNFQVVLTNPDAFAFINHGPVDSAKRCLVQINGDEVYGVYDFETSLISFTNTLLPVDTVTIIQFVHTRIVAKLANNAAPAIKLTIPQWNVAFEDSTPIPTATTDYFDWEYVDIVGTKNQYGAVTVELTVDATYAKTDATSFRLQLSPQSAYFFHTHGDKNGSPITKASVVINGLVSQTVVATPNSIHFPVTLTHGNKLFITFPKLIILKTNEKATQPKLSLDIGDWDIDAETFTVPAPTATQDWREDKPHKDGMSGLAKFFLVVIILVAVAVAAFLGYKYYQTHVQKQHFPQRTSYDSSKYETFEMGE